MSSDSIRLHKPGCTPWATFPRDPSCPGCQAAAEWEAEVRAEDEALQWFIKMVAFYPRAWYQGAGFG